MKEKFTRVFLCILFCQVLVQLSYSLDLINPHFFNPDTLINDSISEEKVKEKENAAIFLKLKPRIGFGVGTLTFMGDVANNYNKQHLTVGKIAYDFRISNKINNFLDLSFYILRGKIAVNEQHSSRNLNFQSIINSSGVLLSYNFDHLLNKERWVEPYVQVGIESLEFLSKTDLYDKNGNKYHYWSTGSIMSKPEDDPEAYSAVILNRDYKYESDLRKLNLDGFGNYAERTLAIPFGVGFKMLLTDELTFQFGTSLHYTFTDYIDNIAFEGKNERKGDKSMDKLLFTSMSLNYLLPLHKKEIPLNIDDEYYALQYGDEDNDGVLDLSDDCLGTSQYATVDKKGCAIDNDKDGIPDYKDEELDSAPNAIVNENGVTLTKEEIAFINKRKQNGRGFKIMRSSFKGLQGKSSEKIKNQSSDQYYIEISEEEANNKATILLNQKDLVTKSKNGQITYKLGPFNSPEEASKRQNQIKKLNITTSELQKADGTLVILPDQSSDESVEKEEPVILENKTVFRVQIGAFSKSVPLEKFSGLPNVSGIKGKDGLVRYMSGVFNNLDDAANHRVQLTLKGYEQTFIVAFKNGKRISLKQAGANFTEESAEDQTYHESAPIIIDKESIKFRVKLGEHELGVPKSLMDALFKLKNVKIMRANGASHYYFGVFDSFEDAEAGLNEAKEAGVNGAFIVGDFDGKIIEAQEAQRLISD